MGLALRRQIGINPEWAVAKQEFIGKEQGQGSVSISSKRKRVQRGGWVSHLKDKPGLWDTVGKDTVDMDPPPSRTWEGILIKLAWQGSLLTMKFVSCLGDSGNRIVWSCKGSVTAETDATPFQELSREEG